MPHAQHMTHHAQHATHNTQHTTHNTQHTTHNTQHTTRMSTHYRLQQLSSALARGPNKQGIAEGAEEEEESLQRGLLPADLLVVDYSKIDVRPRRLYTRSCRHHEGGEDGT